MINDIRFAFRMLIKTPGSPVPSFTGLTRMIL